MKQPGFPLFFWYPDKIQPHRTDQLASFIDLMPTLLNYAGVNDSCSNYQGMNIRPLVEEQKTLERDEVFIECNYYKAVVTSQWKYIKIPEQKHDMRFEYQSGITFPCLKDSVQLFDIQRDYSEQINLACDSSLIPVIRELDQKLGSYSP